MPASTSLATPLFTPFLCVEVLPSSTLTNAERFGHGRQVSRRPSEVDNHARVAHADGVVEDHAFVHFAAGVAQVHQAGILQLQRRIVMDELGQAVLHPSDGLPGFHKKGRLRRGRPLALSPPSTTAAPARGPGKNRYRLAPR